MSSIVRMAKLKDLDSIVKLLKQGKLNVDGIEANIENFVVVENDETSEVIGTAGIEPLDEKRAMLRSLALKQEAWSTNMALGLFKILLQLAVQKGMEDVYLLTRTTSFFEVLGFQVVDKEDLPENIQKSSHFAQIQSGLSTVMVLKKVDKLSASYQN